MFNLNSGYGQLLAMQVASAVGPNFGQILIVSEDSDNSTIKDMLSEVFTTDTEGRVRIFATLEAAYAAAVSNNNDVISESIDWSKSRIHLIGMDGGGRMLQQGAKIENTDGTAAVYVIKNTGTRNSFRNIKFIQVDDDATSLTVFQEAGEGTYFKNCSFVFGVADNLDQTDAYEFVMGGDSITMKECTFGNDTLETSGARAVMAYDKLMSDSPKSNYFEKCLWSINSSEATAHFIRVLANTDMKFSQTFVECNFICALTNSMGTAVLTETVENEVQAVEGNMVFIRPGTNTTDFATATNGNTNIQVIAAVSVNAAIEAITPIA